MNIMLINIQSIQKAVYTFPEKGILQITGPNSGGKSIVMRTLEAIALLTIRNEVTRNTLINDNVQEGQVLLERGGYQLFINLHRERMKSYIVLKRPNEEKIVRTFRDGGLEELVSEFGFRTYGNNAVCLQIYETFGLMPFVNTSYALNSEIVDAITEDQTAKEFLTAFKEKTHPMARTRIKEMNTRIEQLTVLRDSIAVYDPVKYVQMGKKLENAIANLANLEPVNLSKMYILPPLRDIGVDTVNLQKLNIIKVKELPEITPYGLRRLPMFIVLQPIEPLNNITQLINDLNTTYNGVCPTCGKRLVSEEVRNES